VTGPEGPALPNKKPLNAGDRHLPTYSSRVGARLDAAAVEYGNSWRSRRLDDIGRELAEEALDLGGWSSLGLDLLHQLDPAGRAQARALLMELIDLGARAAVVSDRLATVARHNTRRPGE
jgi:hypothetical protein